ncbi:hypothetical protein [Bradyrhizobium sp. SSUT77]|uniref:hypothetical protein n=1 Tax=Bradyrhizobium sp. SSUT77 TaxID=3040603 RepID=UPI00244A97F0|nr:hypothetical protein [Bradyrhizobium sp. SSUT77]MDH2345290.1 hypothetical protein [Bradyrhizobium sp. SSUT77]
MKNLILTSSSGLSLMLADRADVVIPFFFRFVWGPLPSPHELATWVATRSDKHGPGSHWSDDVAFPEAEEAGSGLGLVDFCERYDAIELWFDPSPNDQLLLVWLLDYLRSYPEIVARLKLFIVTFDLLGADIEGLRSWAVRDVDVGQGELQAAFTAWHAYRASTPEACFDLLESDLSALPMFRRALLELLDELPSTTTGLGSSEMRLLALMARGYSSASSLFTRAGLGRPSIFQEFELGSLLEGLAQGSEPAVSGLDDQLPSLRGNHSQERLNAYHRSRPLLTAFGRAVLAYNEDFSRHNAIDRWWGGTRLTNDRLWRYGSVLTKP